MALELYDGSDEVVPVGGDDDALALIGLLHDDRIGGVVWQAQLLEGQDTLTREIHSGYYVNDGYIYGPEDRLPWSEDE